MLRGTITFLTTLAVSLHAILGCYAHPAHLHGADELCQQIRTTNGDLVVIRVTDAQHVHRDQSNCSTSFRTEAESETANIERESVAEQSPPGEHDADDHEPLHDPDCQFLSLGLPKPVSPVNATPGFPEISCCELSAANSVSNQIRVRFESSLVQTQVSRPLHALNQAWLL